MTLKGECAGCDWEMTDDDGSEIYLAWDDHCAQWHPTPTLNVTRMTSTSHDTDSQTETS